MVRRDLRPWAGPLAFVAVVAVLAIVAIGRIPDSSLDGRWDLVLIETPLGSYQPEQPSWLVFDASGFHGVSGCYHITDGRFQVPSDGVLTLDGYGMDTECASTTAVDEAYDTFFSDVSRFKVGPSGLTLQSEDASVEFHYEPAD